jgi:hypothetical protein
VEEEVEGSSTEVKVLKMGGRMEENFVIDEGEVALTVVIVRK